MSSPYFNQETIAAAVTALDAVAGVGILRVSGSQAWPVVRALLRRVRGGGRFFEEIESHKLVRCLLVDRDGLPLDDAMVVHMRAPKSFTGEDVVELHLHGNPMLLRKAMRELVAGGARQALPGEFSFRAFRNGKLSLDQAESVADLISSRSEEGARRALHHLMGHSKGRIDALKKELVDRLAEVEIDIDFSDQGLSLFQHEDWVARLESWLSKVEDIRTEFRRSRPLHEGIRLALVGEPNGGKSSIFNRLLGEDRSIVSQEAGTTRDVVRESIQVGQLLFRISDTAGIRSTANEIESQGIERSFGEAESAHLLLWVFGGKTQLDLMGEYERLLARVGPTPRIIAVWNKCDEAAPDKEWGAFFEAKGLPKAVISAKTGEGFARLLEEVGLLFRFEPNQLPDFSISRMRHYEVLGLAAEAVDQAIQKVKEGELFPDLLAADLRAALHRMGEITGEVTSDDLLNHIFAEFCIGK